MFHQKECFDVDEEVDLPNNANRGHCLVLILALAVSGWGLLIGLALLIWQLLT
ncbi:hypothetical protein [Devosia sediminis]|uniref:Uncharacterized protein n=1 Tax=Devosia sediminis TaxID=2798801 RepID=A0A934IWD1_9HYPH|nr:hypothetical protein [Devosia sediminis]MBJ3784225.1 hypothetical protein [Devosia sediminis]